MPEFTETLSPVLTADTTADVCHGCDRGFCSQCDGCPNCCPRCPECGDSLCECACESCPTCDRPAESLCDECGQCGSCCECVCCENHRCSWRGPSDDRCSTCERCPDHCECVMCDSCGERIHSNRSYYPSNSDSSYCEVCFRDSYFYCEGCQEDVNSDHVCGECDRCEDCCECGHEVRGATYAARPLTYHPDLARSLCPDLPSRRLLSVEIEVAKADEGNDIDRACEKWFASVVADSSLPSDTGFEICTSPAAGRRFIDQLNDIGEALRDQSAEVDSACGLHVHIDARDFSYWEVRKLILLYARVEPALFSAQPASRRHSSYCVPCGLHYTQRLLTPKTARQDVPRAVYGSPSTRYHDSKYDGARYKALNLHSWFFRGTVECRLHTGSVNPRKIIAWSGLWASILDHANRLTERQIASLPRDPFACVLSLCATAAQADYLNERWQRFSPHSVNVS